jgi:P-type Cu+ transporter
MAIDPICGMTVDEASALFTERDRQTFYFGSEPCRQKFLSSPANAKPGAKSCGCCQSPPPAHEHGNRSTAKFESTAANRIYTCPMHPEVTQDHPGNCRKCGMALEPRTDATEGEDSELVAMTKRFWVSTILAVMVFLLAMTADLLPALLPEALSMHYVQWIEFVLAAPVVLWGGWPFFVRAWQPVESWNLNMFTLIGLGLSVAWIYSVVAHVRV